MDEVVVQLDEMGIAHKVSELAGEISFGEQKLVEIARASFCRPRVLLLDEPSTGLNVERQERVQRRVRSLLDSGVAVALIEHNIPFLLELADDVCVLKDGKVFGIFARSETSEEHLRDILGLW